VARVRVTRLSGGKYAELGTRSRTRETREAADGNNGRSVARETHMRSRCCSCGASPPRNLSGGQTIRTENEA
jgi:hypothetical protein